MIDLHRPDEMDDTMALLQQIAHSQTQIAMALMKMAGMVAIDVREDGLMDSRPLTPEEYQQQDAKPPITLAGRTSTTHGTMETMNWVLSPPEPFNNVVLVCSPDGSQPTGMRCNAEKREVGGERRKFKITWEEIP